MTYGRLCYKLDRTLRRAGVVHFSAQELVREDRPPYPPKELWPLIVHTLIRLEWLRAVMGEKPIVVTSCWRNPEHNADVGGGAESLHLEFNAVDFRPSGLLQGRRLRKAYRKLEERPDAELFGLSRYSSFVHLDTRGVIGRRAPARW